MLSFGRLARGKATYLRSDLVQYIQEAGAEALPIVSLISFLIGMIFAFVGVMQLENFGAGIYTADLVAVAMVREMAPIMTAIIMAGRTGASYAAQIGTMKVNEEVDALTTLGMDPVDFLVTPRVIALIIMLPMLTLYGSLMGILGGTFVGLTMLNVSLVQYLTQTVDAVGLDSLLGGLFKSIVYGSLVAIALQMPGDPVEDAWRKIEGEHPGKDAAGIVDRATIGKRSSSWLITDCRRPSPTMITRLGLRRSRASSSTTQRCLSRWRSCRSASAQLCN